MRQRLVIWDVDGTILDSQDEIHMAMTKAFEAEGLAPLPKAAVLAIVGLSLPLAMTKLAPDCDEAQVARLVEGYKAAFRDHRLAHGVLAAPLFPGVRAVLDQLHADPEVTLAVATGKSRRGLDALLEGHELVGHFATTQVADDHPSKPDPAMIRACLQATGIAPEHAVMIGDTTFDMEMARAAGVAAIAVTWGYHPRTALVADAYAECAADLPALIHQLTEVTDG